MSKFDIMETTDVETKIEQEIMEGAFDRVAPKMRDFTPNPYSEQRVKWSVDEVAEAKRKFGPGINSVEAQQFEHLVGNALRMLQVLGEDAETFKTTEYDDYLRHTDMIVRIPTPDGEIAIAVDATLESDTDALKRKKEYSDRVAAHGHAYPIEFSYDRNGTPVGIERMPRLVVSVPRKHTLWDDWVTAQRDLAQIDAKEYPEEFEKYKKKLDGIEFERIPHLILGQMYEHLRQQLEVAPVGSEAENSLERLKAYFGSLPAIQELQKEGTLVSDTPEKNAARMQELAA